MKKKFIIGILIIAIIGYISYPTLMSLKEEYYARKDVEEKFNSNKDNKNNSNLTTDENEETQNEQNNLLEQNTETENETNTEDISEEKEENKETNKTASTTSSNKNTSNKNTSSSSSSSTNKKPSSSSTTTTKKTYAKLSLMDTGANDNIKVSQSGNNFTLTGTMEEKTPTSSIKSGSYIKLKITAPEKYKTEVLEKAKVTLLYNNRTYTQANDNFLESTSSKTKTYFYLEQEFMEGMTISILVDWGNGKEIKYNFTFDVTVVEKQ